MSESRQQTGLDRHDLDYLLAGIMRCPLLELPLRRDHALNAEQEALWQDSLERLRRHEPPQYILSRAWFYGLELEVGRDVLIPRPETEGLVELALRHLQPAQRVLEIGTGSGAIAIALSKNLPATTVTATDCSATALQVAARNAARHACQITFIQTDLFPPEPAQYDLIVSNPPYISAREYLTLEKRVREWEPALALLADEDGLSFYRRILAAAPHFLTPNGLVCFEHGATQRDGILALAEAAGFTCREMKEDLAGRERYLVLRYND